ncbi:uncharacterized protein LOC109999860 [Xyrichtys novacula]|uniref:Uncharacterized protein LOC109999860 n=1 Tax=Xyrichtys novacula TaxID=13765 RepID=A0AAV1GZM6_XYRNO|nr:uncharacterized protein LOC109999860 [Xyrichtys novacula]
MAEFKWIKMLQYLILVPQIAAKTTHYLSVIIRDGAEVTLPCQNVLTDSSNCDSTTWTFSQLTRTAAVDLNATQEDVGRYFCIQEKSGQRHAGEAVVDVSVVIMTEKKEKRVVWLKCRLLTRLVCTHTVEWLPPGPEVDQDFRNLQKLQASCVAMVTFLTSDSVYTSKKYESLQCNLKEHNSNTSVQFTFNPQSSERDTLQFEDIGTTTRKPKDLWWVYLIVALGLTALSVTGVVFIRRKRNKGNKTHTDKNQELSLNSAKSPSAQKTNLYTVKSHTTSYVLTNTPVCSYYTRTEANLDCPGKTLKIHHRQGQYGKISPVNLWMSLYELTSYFVVVPKAEPDDGVSYVSIHHTKKTKGKAHVWGGEETVTYSTVKASTAADPSNLYATIN